MAVPPPKRFATTFPRVGRTNTRTKDLVDLVLLVDRGGLPSAADLRAAVAATFGRRNTYPVPVELPPPPADWTSDYAALAAEAQLPAPELADGYALGRRLLADPRVVRPVNLDERIRSPSDPADLVDAPAQMLTPTQTPMTDVLFSSTAP